MENLVRYFIQFPLQTRLNVKTISIDMYAPHNPITTAITDYSIG